MDSEVGGSSSDPLNNNIYIKKKKSFYYYKNIGLLFPKMQTWCVSRPNLIRIN